MAAPSTFSFHPSTLMGAGSTSPRSGFPYRAILCSVPRISKLRNATTAECETTEGHTVEVSFWLADPPGVSYFPSTAPASTPPTSPTGRTRPCSSAPMPPSSSSPSQCRAPLTTSYTQPPLQETIRCRCSRTPTPAPSESTHMPSCPAAATATPWPSSTAGTYSEMRDDAGWLFHAHVFTSEAQAWRKNTVSLQHLSESDKSLCGHHGLSMQIAVGGDSLGWVDLSCGILLLQDLFDGHPVIRFIHFPESRVHFMDEEDGQLYRPDEYYCNVACCDDLIKFLEIEFDDPAIMASGQGWRATMWNRKISWNEWRRRSTVDVADISVDQSYSALLPVLRDDETQRLELRRLVFYTPVLSLHNDDCFYMIAKVIVKDDTAWIIGIDMECASVKAMAPFSVGILGDYLVTVYRPCVFPKHLNMTPDMANPVNKCFKRLSAKQCLMEVLWTLDWLRELDRCLEIERSTYNTFRLLIQLSPVSSLRSNIGSVISVLDSQI